jgi:hypothetical protein
MHFYATSIQIASDFDVDHDKVLEVIEKMPHEEFRAANIQIFEAQNFKLAQMTEPGFNAIVFYLPRNPDNEEKLLTFRERMFQNKAPVIGTTSIAPSPTASAPTQLSDHARKEAESMITSGQLDSVINDSFSNVHKQLIEKLSGDPGYQNVRAYMKTRRATLGL